MFDKDIPTVGKLILEDIYDSDFFFC